MSIIEVAKDTTPEWWTKLGEKQRENYLQKHPASKMQKVANKALRERLAKHPEDRVKLRGRIKKIAANPAKALAKDFDKIDEGYKNLKKSDKKKIEDQTKEALKKGNHKKILKAIVSTLAVAGTLTIGAGLIASGGLPYMIIASRLFHDTKTVVHEVRQRINDNEPVAKAVFNTVKKTIGSMARDPKMLAAAMIIASKPKADKAEKQDDNKNKVVKEKREPKKQNAPKKVAKTVKGK